MHFSPFEIRELLKAWIVISLAFAIAFGGIRTDAGFLVILGVSLVTVGIGFVFHELAHKWLAQSYGAVAEFKAFNTMLILALITSLFGIILAVPGAVFIKTPIRKDQHGKVALAGPMTNIVLAVFFIAIGLALPEPLNVVARYGALINAWLALFNMMPFLGADGSKVLAWNKPVYITTLIGAGALTAVSYIL